ncbi:MAG: universal stress protein [Desulfuromonadales bacterium]|nr:universal stress protein [Desulfuromonadales bacterium]
MIPTYSTILYATDLTENAAHAFRHAIALAKVYDAQIHILHMMQEMDAAVVSYVASVMGEDKFAGLELDHEKEMLAQIYKKLDRFAAEELAEHPDELARVGSIIVHHGNPVAGILAEADRLSADIIVMGTHGKGALRYAFLGSVAEKVLRKTLRPVLVVPLGS